MSRCILCTSIFDQNFKIPRVLPCGHTFCHVCLFNMIADRISMNCPTCGQTFASHTVQMAPLNEIVFHLMQEFRDTKQEFWDSMEGFWKFQQQRLILQMEQDEVNKSISSFSEGLLEEDNIQQDTQGYSKCNNPKCNHQRFFYQGNENLYCSLGCFYKMHPK